MRLAVGDLASSRTYRHNAASVNSSRSAQVKEEQRAEGEYIPKYINADVEHGHEEANALEKVANK